jgi:type I restriction enzyme S subunit
MKEWKEYKLGQVVVLNYGKSLPEHKRLGGKIPVYSSAGITGWHNEPLIKDAGIIIGRKGSIGTVYYSDKPFFSIDTTYYIIRNDANYDLKFLYYLLTSLELNLLNEDSAVPGLNRNTAYDQDILLPPLPEQTAIAEVLSSLDDKIDLLHRQNKTLEQLAETLFRQWFVEEAEESWEVGLLEDEFEFVMGQSPSGDTLNEEKKGMIFFQGRSDFGFRFPEPRVYTTSPTRIAKPLDTLVSVRAPVGDINMAFEECCLGRGVAAFRFKHNTEFYSYTYYKMKSLTEQIKQFEDSGTVFGSIGKDDFKKLECVIPPSELILKFQKNAKPIDDKIKSNTHQIRTLTQLRDTLLPKLMSGEVRVN